MKKSIIVLFIGLLLMASHVQAESADEIIRKTDQKMRGQSSYTE